LQDFTNRRARYLSGGMKQKLGLASALVHHPRLLLLDEPTGGVDPVTRQDFWQLILRLVTQDQIAVLVSTPYMDEATRCTRVGFMRSGRLAVSGTPRALRDGLKDRILELQGQPLPPLRALAGADQDVETVQSFGDRLHLRVRPGTLPAVRQRLADGARAAGHAGLELRPVEPQLEDVFIEILERQHPHD
jgi:ABC-2 type transport system ATP-binding protein